MEPKIIFEDEVLLAIDKPAGLVVNRSATSKTDTLQDWIETRDWWKKCVPSGQSLAEKEFSDRSGIVHRLDKDTSGVMVVAKNFESFAAFKTQFQDRKTRKKYLALAHGLVEPPIGTINAPIERSPYNRMHYGVFPGGRDAETSYKVIKLLSRIVPTANNLVTNFSLLEVIPKTGRTHQIRVHLKYVNHPIVSDPIYGGRKQSLADREFCPRLFLHAQSLAIIHPLDGKEIVLTTELPEDLDGTLRKLEQLQVTSH